MPFVFLYIVDIVVEWYFGYYNVSVGAQVVTYSSKSHLYMYCIVH